MRSASCCFTAATGTRWCSCSSGFLKNAAESGYAQALSRELLKGVLVRDIMTKAPVWLPASLPASRAVDEFFLENHHVAFPVCDDEGLEFRGLLRLEYLKEIPREKWPYISAGDLVAAHDSGGLSIPVGERANRALQRLLVSGQGRLAVLDGTQLAGEGEVERSAYCIHAPIHRLNLKAAAVFHTHMPHASALTRLEDQSILPIGQTELGTLMHTAYDDLYTGPAFDPAEGERLAAVMGDKTVLMMANHGVATVGNSVSEAYDRLYYVERVAQVQLYAMWTGRPLKHLPRNVIDHTIGAYKAHSHQYGGKPNHVWHFAALKRILDRKEPDYKD